MENLFVKYFWKAKMPKVSSLVIGLCVVACMLLVGFGAYKSYKENHQPQVQEQKK